MCVSILDTHHHYNGSYIVLLRIGEKKAQKCKRKYYVSKRTIHVLFEYGACKCIQVCVRVVFQCVQRVQTLVLPF